jgi:hypothetical protein
MREEAQRFYARARECRAVAERSHDEAAAKLLIELADELEAEAVKIEEETPEPS